MSAKAEARRGVRKATPVLGAVAIQLAGLIALQWGQVDVAAVGALLILVSPGLVAARLIWDDGPSQLVLGLTLGLALSVLLGLVLVWLPMRFDRMTIVSLWLTITLALSVAATIWGRPTRRADRTIWIMLGAVALASLILRLAGAARSELMGDEAKVLLWATDVIQGRENIILLHRKGPAEMLVAALQYALLGKMTSLAGRLPFVGASVMGALSLALLARELFGWRAGLIAGLIASVDGFLLGFGHVIQYPNLVLCFGIASVAATWQLIQQKRMRLAALIAILSAALALCHWDAIWYLAMILWLLGRALADGQLRWRAGVLAAGVALGGVMAAVVGFYIPYFTSPAAQAIGGYLADRLAGNRFMWRLNLDSLASYGIIYNAIYYAAALVAAALVGIALAVRNSRLTRKWQRGLLVGFGLLCLATILAIDPVHVGRGVALWVVLCCLAYISIGDGTSAHRLGAVWLIVPLAGYLFVIKKPLLSVYNIIPGAALAAAWALDRLLSTLRSFMARKAVGAALIALYVLSAGYALLVFGSVDREYIRTFPASRSPLYWSPYADELPKNAGVGFAHRAGWETIGQLYACGQLEGTYWSNEEELITHWYTRGAIRCISDPKYVFVADHVKDVEDDLPDLGQYRWIGRVQGAQASGIAIWARRDLEALSRLACERQMQEFAALTAPRLFTARPRLDPLSDAQEVMRVPLDGQVALRGLSLAVGRAEPGETVEVRAYYQVLEPIQREINISLQLGRGAETYHQQDMAIDCGLLSTEDWGVDNWFIGRYGLEIADDTPPGWYQVTLAAYALEWVDGKLEPVVTPLCDLESQRCMARLPVGKLQIGAPQPPTPSQRRETRFGDTILLWGYDAVGSKVNDQDGLIVTLHWEQLAQAAGDWVVFVHLLDGEGRIVAQHDGEPEQGLNPTSTWAIGEWVVDVHELQLPDDLPAGPYALKAGLYRRETGERLSTASADHVDLGQVWLATSR